MMTSFDLNTSQFKATEARQELNDFPSILCVLIYQQLPRYVLHSNLGT